MGSAMTFHGRLIYADAATARAAADALPGRDDECILGEENGSLIVRGAQIDITYDNVCGSGFFEGTEVAMTPLAEAAFVGSMRGVFAGSTSFDREAGAKIPGCPKPKPAITRLLRTALMADSEASAAYAHGQVKPADVPALAAIHDALVEPVHRARIARLMAGRAEAEAQRVMRALAAMKISTRGPWADELRRIQATPMPVKPASEPFLVGWVVRQSELAEPARTANARAKVTLAIVPMLAARYRAMDSHLARARLLHVLVGRPRIHHTADVQAMIADLLGREIAGPDADELRAIHAAAAAARKAR